MSTSFNRILSETSPILDNDSLWNQAIREAGLSSTMRAGEHGESARDRMLRLKDSIKGEMVAFHNFLPVRPYVGPVTVTRPDAKLYEVEIPLTLFPKRSQGFSRVECVVEFDSSADNSAGPRILKAYPENRNELLAKAGITGKIALTANAKAGLKNTGISDAPVADIAANVYAGVEIPGLSYQAKRICVLTEIIHGHGARWRLEDPQDREQLSVETHQLSVILEVVDADLPVNAAGYLNAYSDTRWLSASLGSLWEDFSGAIGNFFRRGLPTEAYGEWQNIIG